MEQIEMSVREYNKTGIKVSSVTNRREYFRQYYIKILRPKRRAERREKN